jgi:hypothetical protein
MDKLIRIYRPFNRISQDVTEYAISKGIEMNVRVVK